ncbi:MAG TPA: glycosyltransferase family 39 protein [Asticcacaulis sp.]|nr:glycosyltransferase family 39 protein [Asticcacaulis sp.]
MPVHEQQGGNQSLPRLDRNASFAAMIVTVVRFILGARYDLFRDELYFIVCGQHPAFGYVDQPPLIPILSAILYQLKLGALGVRIPTALAAGAIVYLTIRFVKLLGGGRISVVLATLAVVMAPILMGMGDTLNPTCFDPLAWTAIAYLLVRAIRLGDNRALLFAGVIAGIDMEVKYALPMWAAGLFIGLLATERRVLQRPAFWGGLALAAIIALPSLIWQAMHGFPFLELMAAAKGKNADVALGPFVLNQIFVMNPILAPLWMTGLVAPFVSNRLKDLRFIPIAYAVFFVLVRLGHGKDYYLAACYPALFIIGGVALGDWASTRVRRGAVVAGMVLASVVSAIMAPLMLPLLPPSALIAYINRTGLAPQQQERGFQGTTLPQLFADQLGWHDFADEIAAAWTKIPVSERAQTGIKLDNYGEAAAVDLYASSRGLPPVLSGHNQYYLWGLRDQHPTSLLVLQSDVSDLRPYCEEVIVLGKTYSPFAMAYENNMAIAYCRGLRMPIEAVWRNAKHYS